MAEADDRAAGAPPEDDATRIVERAPSVERSATSAGAAPRPQSGILRPGQILGHTYEIEARLARGGMGEVYRARHVELNSRHAIKVILPELANDERIVGMFNEEALKLRRVRDDAVVAYDGMQRDENGLRYLVMEFVDGVPLTQVIATRALPPDELRTLRDRLAQGLAAAHDKQIIHRDISPDNIILVESRVELAKIIDFGIAKAAAAGDRTIIGSDFAGKYSFISPEQLGMFGGKVDARSDIYSLGLVLAAACLGRQIPMGNSPATAIEARRAVPDLAALPADLRAELAPLLEPDPADRPRSMRELPGSRFGASAAERSDAIRAMRQQILTPPPPRRSRAPLIATAALSFAVVVGGGAAYFLLRSPASPPSPVAVASNPPAAAPEISRAGAPAAAPPVQPAETTPPAPVATPVPPPAPVAVVTPPAAPAAVPDRAAIAQRLGAVTQAFACADLKTSLSPDLDLAVKGFVASAADATKLRQALDDMPNLRHVDASVAVYVWPHCEVAKLFGRPDLGWGSGARAPALAFNIANLVYHAGDKLVVRATAGRATDGWLYVDFYDNSGNVVHLFPRPRQLAKVKAGQVVTLGTDAPNPRQGDPVYEISEPFGPNLVAAVYAADKLMDARPNEIESAKDYLPALERSLEQGGGSKGNDYAFITTLAR